MVMQALFALFLTIPLMGLLIWLIPIQSFMIIFFLIIWIIWIYVLGLWNREWNNNKNDEEMYYWLQNFITTLSIKKTITETYVDLSQRYQLQKVNWLHPYTSNDVMQTITNLKQRFRNPIYDIFSSTLSFYEQQGGDVINLFDSILSQTRLMETRRIEVYRYTKRYFFQWLFLWLLNGLVLILSKVMLLDLYIIMENALIFQLLVVFIISLVPITHCVWFYQWIQVKRKLR